MRTIRLTALAALALAVLVAEPAGATFPGRNGEIAISTRNGGKYSMQQAALLAYTPPSRASVRHEICSVRMDPSPLYCRGLERASFSPDGATIAVIADEGPGTWPGTAFLWLLTLDGQRTDRVPLATWYYDVRWAPDASAFVATRFLDPNETSSGPERRTAVVVLNRDGSERTLLAADGSEPDWCADGRVVVAQHNEIWLLDVTRPGGVRRLTYRGGADPSCAPDSRRVAFTRRGAIWTVRTSGGRARRLTPGAAPVWSPDGKQIAYFHRRRDRASGLDFTFINRIGLRRLRIRQVSGTEVLTNDSYDDTVNQDPDWQAVPGP
jgi:Tol biopolymer transport system component